MPKKYDNCVKKVKKSLKKYNHKGNAYAICNKSLKGKRGAKMYIYKTCSSCGKSNGTHWKMCSGCRKKARKRKK